MHRIKSYPLIDTLILAHICKDLKIRQLKYLKLIKDIEKVLFTAISKK